MTPERNFRTSDHTAFDEDMSLRMTTPEDVRRMTTFGLVALAIFLAMLALWGATLTFASSQNKDRSLYRELDLEFERHVEEQTKKLCRYEWRVGRTSFWPERVLVCGKGRG